MNNKTDNIFLLSVFVVHNVFCLEYKGTTVIASGSDLETHMGPVVMLVQLIVQMR